MREWNVEPFGITWVGGIVECCQAQHFACPNPNFHAGLILTNVGTIIINILTIQYMKSSVHHIGNWTRPKLITNA